MDATVRSRGPAGASHNPPQSYFNAGIMKGVSTDNRHEALWLVVAKSRETASL